MALAASPRAPLEGHAFQVVVIGGGINGVAVARQCARAGKRTLLIEQTDFASGVTSRSTRIIHGGLRYLEHAEIGLVRESLREREKLLRERSHLVHPMQFLLLLNENSQRSALKVRAGLWVYRHLAGKSVRAEASKMELKRLERALDSGHRWSFFDYEDAQCEFPERLVAEWLMEAVEAGATVRNHTEALAVDVTHGRVRGVLLRDQLTGRDERIDAAWVIKVYTEASDGRPFFVLPWNDQILVGTTEVADNGDPGRTVPSAEEIAYLVKSVAQLFPKAKISAQSVKHAFAGIRPLPYSPDNKPSAVTRRHILHDHADDGAARMISVIGGKLTTASSLARECARKIGLSAAEPNGIAVAPGPALDPVLDGAGLEIARIGSVSEETARGMLEWYGKRASDIARMALVSAELRAPICPHTSHIVAEVVEAYRRVAHPHRSWMEGAGHGSATRSV